MPLLPRLSLNAPAVIALAAAGYAAAEFLLALTIGRFAELGRAEALSFLAWRPWLLIAAAALAAPYRWANRLTFYLSALLLASLCEFLFLSKAGAGDPWPGMLRGLAAAILVLAPADLLVQAGRRWRGRIGSGLAAAAIALLLLVPASRQLYDKVALGPAGGAPARNRPGLVLMTGLPIVWGERGAFHPGSRPALSYVALQEEYDIRPIDVADDAALARGRLLLLAQPGWLAPAELAAIDSWVRKGGRALILADPTLSWPSDLPLGDVRRPVPASLLGPLLTHWGIELRQRPGRPAALTYRFGRPSRSPAEKLVLESPGLFVGRREGCATERPSAIIRCAVGRGRAILIADADLLRDDLWAAPGPGGDSRHRRIADNPLVVADMLDELAGIDRPRVRGKVEWAHYDGPNPAVGMATGLVLAMLPAILVACGGLLLALLRKTKPQTYPQDYKG